MHIFKAIDFIGENRQYNSTICAEARTLSMHSHDFFEIAYVMEGYGTHYTSDKTDFIKEGDFIFISPGVKHCTVSPADESIPRIRVCNCLFVPEYFNKAMKRFLELPLLQTMESHKFITNTPFCLIMHDTQTASIKNTIQSIKNEIDLYPENIDAIINNHLNNFLIEANRIYSQKLNTNTFATTPNLLIQDLTSYIKANLDLPLTLESLAKRVHFSPEYLSRYFKKHTGKTLSTVILELRMEKAKELLRHTSYPISEIGYLCGYSSISNFRKYFGKAIGLSPSAYRKKCNHSESSPKMP